jgi:hypothetical protein
MSKDYGKLRKKIIFYDTDKRYADLKIRLEHDGISQAAFFRGIVSGYLLQDENVLEYIDKLKASKKVGNRNKKEIKQERELVNSGKETMQKLALSEEEIEDIFDLLEKQGQSATGEIFNEQEDTT